MKDTYVNFKTVSKVSDTMHHTFLYGRGKFYTNIIQNIKNNEWVYRFRVVLCIRKIEVAAVSAMKFEFLLQRQTRKTQRKSGIRKMSAEKIKKGARKIYILTYLKVKKLKRKLNLG